MKNYNIKIDYYFNTINNTTNNDRIESLELLQGLLMTCKSYHNKIKRLSKELDYFKKSRLAMYYNIKSYNKGLHELQLYEDEFQFYKNWYNNIIMESSNNKSLLIK